MNHLPKYVANFMPQILPTIWETKSAKVYQEDTVNGDSDNDIKEVDSDGMH